jgi:hypothetical protein
VVLKRRDLRGCQGFFVGRLRKSGPALGSIQFRVGNEVEKAEGAEKTNNCNGQ